MKPRVPMLEPSEWARLLRQALAMLALVFAVVLMAAPSHAQPVPHAALQYRAELVRAAHTHWGLDAPVALLAAQVHQESAWRPGAVSHVGAAGLAQFMPATAAWLCGRTGTPSSDCLPHNPTWALRALVQYDRWLYDRLAVAGEAGPRWWATLRAYNGGLGHWQAEARVAGSTAQPAVDAACGRARRAALHCTENLAYPQRIMVALQPRYASWGLGVAPPVPSEPSAPHRPAPPGAPVDPSAPVTPGAAGNANAARRP